MDYAEEAHRELSADESLTHVRAGWARQVRSTIRDLSGEAPGVRVEFRVRDDHVTMVPVSGSSDRLAFFIERLEASTRARCQHCGRGAEDEARPGICSGCLAIQARGYTIFPAYADDGLPS
jgi:hypothetical protein